MVVAVRAGAISGTIAGPAGQWRDVLRSEERSFASNTRVQDLTGDFGIAVYERL